MRLFSLILLVALSVGCCGYSVPSKTRRAVCAGALAAGSALQAGVVHASTRADLLGGQGQGCTYGVGDNCDDLAEGNALILRLQQKSRDNAERNERDLYEKTTAMLGYDDYLMSSDKVMVRVDVKEGKFAALSLSEYADAKKAGRITPGDNGIDNLDAAAVVVEQRELVSNSYDRAKQLVLAGKVEGVVFKAPSGLTALAIAGDDVLTVEFDKAWKREEFFKICEKQLVPNNLKDVMSGKDALAQR